MIHSSGGWSEANRLRELLNTNTLMLLTTDIKDIEYNRLIVTYDITNDPIYEDDWQPLSDCAQLEDRFKMCTKYKLRKRK